jgi:uncharacterized membrane-anchored protein
MTALTSRPARVAGAALLQLALVAGVVSGQLSARLTGDEHTIRVQPVDPIDPVRGAYVTLDYPDLVSTNDDIAGEPGDLYLPLVADGEFSTAGEPTRTRPSDGPYLACDDRDWRVECGIDSWFLPQDEAVELEEALRDSDVVARVRVDDRGNAALVGVTVR